MQQCALYIKEYCFWAARDAEQRVWAEQNLVKKAAAPAVGKVAGTEAAAALWGWKLRGYYRLFLACMKCGANIAGVQFSVSLYKKPSAAFRRVCWDRGKFPQEIGIDL